ncbi:D-alanine aminotransferase [Anaerohalosphaera lusitana]|uniref:D-alanine aminotransferase n=1 Tax=Anaerohalosphaera lusitana TaxID=1936003 RepID=A0A1U9NPN6_9BACT|nr:aminotransferase class IV [Anaerohalosphaera lusitana]AQT69678.1 D-alanine aminotransferase [Anaerohalosphaera lusitana]
MEIAVINDKQIPLTQLDPAYLDRGTYFGDGVYEVVRSYDGRIFALDDHLARFARSMREIQITGLDLDHVRKTIRSAFAQAEIPNARIYFHVTRGSERREHAPSPDLAPNFFLTVTEIGDCSARKAAGVKVATYPDIRWKRCDIKSLNLLPNVMARMEAKKKGCDEAILVDEKGDITEGAGSAFFMIDASNRHLITRPLGREILPSITRRIVEQIAPAAGLTVIERTITPRQAKKADELFLAVTTTDITGITHFDEHPIANATPGPYTKALAAEFQKLVKTQTS